VEGVEAEAKEANKEEISCYDNMVLVAGAKLRAAEK
jgi:hypothetical protein